MAEKQLTLLKSQRADLGEILEVYGISPRDCKWVHIDSPSNQTVKIPVLTLKSQTYAFGFDKDYDSDGNIVWECHLIPSFESDEEVRKARNWDGVKQIFNEWCSVVSRELTANDPWEEAAEEFSENFTSSSSNFTDVQLQKLDERLDEVRAFLIEESDKSQDTILSIEAGITDLKKSARVLGRKDWALLFAGWFFTKSADWAVGQVHWGHVITILLKGTRTFLLQV
jgi:hypothetical protein